MAPNISRLLPIVFLVGLVGSGCSSGNDWRTASRASAGIAPNPAETHEAVLHVYGARAWEWRGWFAIHTWIAKQVPELDVDLPVSAIGSGYAK
jgi:hypothetical protein